jgi:hypothetical protein
VNHLRAVTVLAKVREAVGERAYEPEEAVVQEPRDDGDAECPPRAPEVDWLASPLRLTRQGNERRLARAVVGRDCP